jgi:hypothetical protein
LSRPGQQRERALRRLQRGIERYYALERAPDVALFVADGVDSERETLLVRETEEAIELQLVLPAAAPEAGVNDLFLQLVEGVSHFVYIAERARTGLPATQLELELQAEVDKFVMLGMRSRRRDRHASLDLHQLLYERVEYLHPETSEEGHRYRMANELAARFTARLLDLEAQSARLLLQRFYRAGQSDKIRLARAA